jgi:phage shock protein A
MEEMQRSLGRIESNVKFLVDRAKKQEEDADKLEERIRKVEKKVNYAAGVIAAGGMSIASAWKWLT